MQARTIVSAPPALGTAELRFFGYYPETFENVTSKPLGCPTTFSSLPDHQSVSGETLT